MRDDTQIFLRSIGLGAWLRGYEVLGNLIDTVADGNSYELQDIVLYQAVRRAIYIAWRTNPEKVADVMMVALDRPPTARKFVYSAADYLNERR